MRHFIHCLIVAIAWIAASLPAAVAVLALALERLSRYVTPEVEGRAKRLVPRWLVGGEQPTEDENPPGGDPGEHEHEQGDHDDAEEEEGNEGRGRTASSTEEAGPRVATW